MHLVESSHFDLVLTDILMLESDGIEVIMELRRSFPTIKIIAMSAGGRLGAEDYLDIARKLGATKTLAKPFSASQLLEAVNTVLKPENESVISPGLWL